MEEKRMILTATTVNQIITQLASCSKLKQAARNNLKFNASLYEDLLQELYIFLLKQKEELIINLYHKEQLFFYCLNFFKLQTRSNTSPFIWKNCRQSNAEVELPYFFSEVLPDNSEKDFEEEIEQEQLSKINSTRALSAATTYIQNNLHWYDKMLFSEYVYTSATTRSIATRIDIPLTSVHNTLNKVSEEINQYLRTEGINKPYYSRKKRKKGRKK